MGPNSYKRPAEFIPNFLIFYPVVSLFFHHVNMSQNAPPINGLPVELLSFIFFLVICVPADTPADGDTPDFNGMKVIQCVDKHWRNVALDTPGLWANINVDIDMVDPPPAQDVNDFPRSGPFRSQQLEMHIKHSRSYPLDIVIDARDPDWNFEEPELEVCDYIPPFSCCSMRRALTLLLPHLSRWRSFAIYTDTWAPMYIALQQIQPRMITSGAPLLKSLALVRRNACQTFAPVFIPHEMKDPTFFTLDDDTKPSRPLLPCLQDLTLKGVHVNWPSLASILAHSQSPVRSLELALHCLEVRPFLSDFRNILAAIPLLTRLIIDKSGPVQEPVGQTDDNLTPALLSHLRDISISYINPFEGLTILRSFTAPNAKVLVIENQDLDFTEEGDVAWLLAYIGTGYRRNNRTFMRYISERHGGHHMPDNNKQTPEPTPQALFPLLETVILKNIHACAGSFRSFFRSTPNIRTLKICSSSAHAIYALFPYTQSHPGAPLLLPQLQSLSVVEPAISTDILVPIFGSLFTERQKKGACHSPEVEIYIRGEVEQRQDIILQEVDMMLVTIFVQVGLDYEDESDEDYDENAVGWVQDAQALDDV